MLIYPTIKEAPIAGLSGFGGGVSSLSIVESAPVAVLGNAGKSDSNYFFRPAQTGNDIEDEKGNFPDFHVQNPGNTTAMVATTNMPPGMGAARLNTSNASFLKTDTHESFGMMSNKGVGGFVMPTSATTMRMLFFQSYVPSQNYSLFVTDTYASGWPVATNARYDWPENGNYHARGSENTAWGVGGNNELLDDTWNHFRFGRDNNNDVRLVIHTWDGSSWTERCDLTDDGGSTVGGNGDQSYSCFFGQPSQSRGIIGYWGNVYHQDFSSSDWDSTPPSD